MSKYVKDVSEYPLLTDLISALGDENSAEFPAWKQTILGDLKNEIQEFLKDHHAKSARTRSQYVSMKPEHVWENEEEVLFNLTEKPRPILGYLPKAILQEMNDKVSSRYSSEVDMSRDKLNTFQEEMRASQSDKAELTPVLELEATSLENIGKYLEAAEFWEGLHGKKTAILEQLAAREDFLEEIEEFEKESSKPDRYKTQRGTALAEENKFRAYAAKKIKKLDAEAVESLKGYKEETDRVFEVDGTDYLEMIKEQQFGRSTNPELSLRKLRVDAIPRREKEKYENSTDDGMGKKKRSMLEEGKNPNRVVTSK